MSLEHAILGFLSTSPMSGYDLKTRCLDGASRHVWTADQAQVYRTLDRLAERRQVTSVRQRQTGRPDRKVYRITPAGAAALATWLAASTALPPHKDPFLLQLLFASDLPDDALGALLSERRRSHQARLDDIRAQIGDLSRSRGLSARTATLQRMALDGAAAVERAAIDWLDDCAELAARGLPGSPDTRPGSQPELFPTRERDTAR